MTTMCSTCGTILKQGGCFGEIYEWCPKCEMGEVADNLFDAAKTEPYIHIDWTWTTTRPM